MKIAYVNFQAHYDIQANFKAIMNIVEQQGAECDCIIFPEAALQGYFPFLDEKSIKSFSQNAIVITEENPMIRQLLDVATQHKVNIVLGVIEQDADMPERLYNSALLVQPEHKLHVYRKVHLATNEHYIFHPGNAFQVIDTSIGKMGFLICYDICFPEAARTLALAGAQIIVLLSAWGFDEKENNGRAKSSEIFQLYAQARAVENQVFFIVANQSGNHLQMQFLGESKAILPNGMIHSIARSENEVGSAQCDLHDALLEERLFNLNALNLLKNRRPETYHLGN